MRRPLGRKPSPALAISIVALVFALAGTSIAGVATISVLNKKEKKQTRNIARDEIKKAAPGLSVANATNAGQLGGRPAGDYLVGHSRGVALAGARIDSAGGVVKWFNTLGGSPTVSKQGLSSYFLTFPGLSNTNEDVFVGTLTQQGEIVADSGDAGATVFVQTFNSTGNPSPAQFSVVVYGASSSG